MTKEDWEYVDENLKSTYSTVKLKCDQFNLSLSLQRINQFKNGIVFYVDSSFKGGWLNNDCEERRRFCRISYVSVYTEKEKKLYKKFGVKMLKDVNIVLDKKASYYTFYWNSFTALKRHLIKNNEIIELVRE